VLATTISSPYGALINTLAYGGLRWGEVAALRRGRCELLRSRLHVVESLSETSEGLLFGPTKTYQRRTVVIPGFLRDLLAEHLVTEVEPEDDALVFSSPGAEPLRRGNFSRRLRRPALEAAGLVLRPHDDADLFVMPALVGRALQMGGDRGFGVGIILTGLRHTCAALLVAEGAHPKAVQVHLGHSSIQVTMDRYGHLFPSDAEDLADRLDATHRQALTDTKGAASRSEVLQLPVA